MNKERREHDDHNINWLAKEIVKRMSFGELVVFALDRLKFDYRQNINYFYEDLEKIT